jgi:hypothetical protein
VALANVHELSGPSYAVSVHYFGAVEPPYAFVTLAADGSIMSTQPSFEGETLAAEALANKSVAATGVFCSQAANGICLSWFISVYDL